MGHSDTSAQIKFALKWDWGDLSAVGCRGCCYCHKDCNDDHCLFTCFLPGIKELCWIIPPNKTASWDLLICWIFPLQSYCFSFIISESWGEVTQTLQYSVYPQTSPHFSISLDCLCNTPPGWHWWFLLLVQFSFHSSPTWITHCICISLSLNTLPLLKPLTLHPALALLCVSTSRLWTPLWTSSSFI